MAAIIGRLRLRTQGIAGARPARPEDVVARLGAVQAQDYLGALWAVGLRVGGAQEADVERALTGRRLVRTWALRGTLHLVAAADIHWMLALLMPRIIALGAARHRQLGLDEATFARSREVCHLALQGGRQLTRPNLFQALESGGISTAGQRGIHILGRLAHEGLICFGARQGKQFTFTLLDEWLAPAHRPGKQLAREDALKELTQRYFTSRGPATVADFAWWAGLTLADARAGLEMARPHLASDVIAGETYWRPSALPAVAEAASAACLLPAFDEYLVGYQDRDAVLDPAHVRQINAGGGMLNPVIVTDGQVAGIWKRTLKKSAVFVTPVWFIAPKTAQLRAFTQAAERYGEFLGLRVEVA